MRFLSTRFIKETLLTNAMCVCPDLASKAIQRLYTKEVLQFSSRSGHVPTMQCSTIQCNVFGISPALPMCKESSFSQVCTLDPKKAFKENMNKWFVCRCQRLAHSFNAALFPDNSSDLGIGF